MSQSNNKNYIIAIIILALALCGVAYLYIPQNVEKAKVVMDNFPNKVGGWNGKNIQVDTRTYELLNPDGLLFKEYTNNKGERVQLVIVLGLNKRESFHPPEVCYTGNGGFVDVETQESIVLSSNLVLRLNKLVIKSEQSKINQLVMYWFTANDKPYASYYLQQMAIVMNQLRYKNGWGSLVRVSTNKYSNENMDQANIRLEKFVRDIYPLLSEFVNPS